MRTRSLGLVAVVAVLIVAIAFVNYLAQRSINPPPPSQQNAPPAAPSSKGPPPPAGEGNNAALVTEETDGNPATAATRVTLGFTVDDPLMKAPQTETDLVTALRAWQKGHPTSSLQVVCLDIPPAERADPTTAGVPLGVAVNGTPIAGASGNVGTQLLAPGPGLQALLTELSAQVKH